MEFIIPLPITATSNTIQSQSASLVQLTRTILAGFLSLDHLNSTPSSEIVFSGGDRPLFLVDIRTFGIVWSVESVFE